MKWLSLKNYKKIFQTLTVVFLNFYFSSVLAAERRCESFLNAENGIFLTPENWHQIANKPLLYLNQKIRIQDGLYSRVRGPFRIVLKTSQSQEFQRVMKNIEILSRDSQAREKVFGGISFGKEYVINATKKTIDLSQRQYFEDGFVEVGAILFHLNTGEIYTSYYTSNHKSGISTPYEHYVHQINEINLQDRQITLIQSMHTHPVDLFPSIEDMIGYRQEISFVKTMYPHVHIDRWTMHTVRESESVLHEVQLSDWEKVPKR